MRNKNFFLGVGVLIFIITYMINRFIIEISDPVYIGILIVAIISMIAGMLDLRKDRENKE